MNGVFAMIAVGDLRALETAPAEWLTSVIEARNERSQTPVMVAASLAQWKITDFLIARGADLKAVDDRGKSGHAYLAKFGTAHIEQEVRADIAAAVMHAQIEKALEENPAENEGAAASGRSSGGVVL